jgi:hypothetical protein
MSQRLARLLRFAAVIACDPREAQLAVKFYV